MAHPTCALARHLPPPPTCAGSFSDGDHATLSTQADTEAEAAREALRATIHLRKLVVLAQNGGSAQRDIHAPELLLLIAIVEAEFNRRMRAVMGHSRAAASLTERSHAQGLVLARDFASIPTAGRAEAECR